MYVLTNTNCPSFQILGCTSLIHIGTTEIYMMESIKAYLNSPMGPKTTHFWGPMANWGFVISGMIDTNKAPHMISGNMTAVLCIYSILCMRFAWMVRPRNHMLLACHAANESVQLYQLYRWFNHQRYRNLQSKEDEVATE